MKRTPPAPPPPRVVIVGGGLAGLATAATLVGRGLRITLLESRPRLGGRAGSFTDPVTGELVDNCQHVSMVCCTNLADFCRRVGIDGLFRREPAITFLAPDGRTSTLRAGLGPAPFHLGLSFLRSKHLRWGDKLRVAYGLARLALDRDAGRRAEGTFADWLIRHRQTVRTMNLFWGPVLVSALNERLDLMDVGLARQVFVDGFLMNRRGFQMEIPAAPLGELYGAPLEAWLRARGVEVRLTTGVRSIDPDPEDASAVGGVTLRNGEALDADFVVATVPFDRVGGLLDPAIRALVPALEGLKGMESSPITGVHLWFDRPVCPLDHVVAPGRLLHWVFNHSALQGRGSEAGGQYLQVVISAAYDLVGMDKGAIRDAVLADLAEMWPVAREAKLLRWWVVTEHGATFAARPGVAALRPPQRTPVDGLFLAGDWTDTGWPATMEGAVRSGYLASQGVLEDLGSPERLVRPDLPPDRLARFLLGSPEPSEKDFTPDFEECADDPAGGPGPA
ncbi:hydroxysqualene dehydroxylase HpnE [Planctomyces sp. SH-PL62]|uniref:hydroxysqualene dehydroxylase HpnE n=1 Tax=Planctomyces sp. SH-PL62 TaxID=1636152 RepID=UPI00078BC452|nr:hydroxysqualene dehydroxylase HpnE [Planctomyces sp. SH-PL62]AMV37591.1 15-cis-phytoene desaturase [Planctomyces sp. SH-PL62]